MVLPYDLIISVVFNIYVGHAHVRVCVSKVGEPRKIAEKHVYVKKKIPIKSIG